MSDYDPIPADHNPHGGQTHLKLFNVVLLNDDEHSLEYVVEMLQAIFGYPPEVGHQLADAVDRDGRVVVFTSHQELAEMKKEFIDDYGPDPRIEECVHSMQAVIEPAGDGA